MLTITFIASEALAVVTVMPVVARDLGGLDLYGWVFSAFMLGSVVGIVVAGRQADRRGPALPYVGGLLLFATGLLVAGLAPAMPVLVAGRALQGLGAGAVPAVAYVAIGRCLPDRLRPRMMAVLSTAWVAPGLAGPAASAAVAHLFGWRWVFLGLVPIVVVTGALAIPALIRLGRPPQRASGEPRGAEHRVIDGLGAAAGAALLLAGLTEVSGSGAGPLLGAVLIVCRGGARADRAAAAAPGRDHPRPARPARHDPQPRPAHLRVLRGRCLRHADHHHGPPPQPGAGRRGGDRLHAGLDGRRLDPGPDERALAGPAAGPDRPVHRAGRDRPGWP